MSSKKDKKPTRKRPPAVKYDKFVRLWQTSKSVSDVATKLGVARTTASAIASRLRAEGVELKKFPRRVSQPIDASALNRIAKR